MGNDLSFNIVADAPTAIATFDKLSESVDKLAIKIDALDHAKADPKVSVDTTEANAKLDALDKKISALNVSPIGAGIFAGLAGAGAVVGASLLVIPAAIAAIGVAAEKSNPQVVTAFRDMDAAAKQAAQQGLSPLVPALVGLANQAQSSLGGIKSELAQASAATAPLLTIIGSDFIKATQQGIGASVPIIQGLRPVAQALGDDLVKVEQGVAGFVSKLDPGPAAQGLANLGTEVGDLLPKVGTLVNDIVPLGNDLLNVVGPALNATAQDAHLLAVPLQAIGSAVGFLGPLIGATVPPVLALAAGSKLLTGSWTDFGGAAQKLISPIQNYDQTLGALGNKIGITTAGQNAANKVALEAALVRARLAQQTAQATALESAFAAEEAGTAEAELAAVAAADELSAADAALAAAETAATGAAEGLKVALGPIGLIVGIAASALTFLSMSSDKTTGSIGDLTQAAGQLADSAPEAISGLVKGNDQVAYLVNQLGKAGLSITDFQEAANGNADAQKRMQKAIDDSNTSLDNQIKSANLSSSQVMQLTKALNGDKDAYDSLDPTMKKIVDHATALKDSQTALSGATQTNKQRQDALLQTLQQQGVVLPQVVQGWAAFGQAVAQRVTDFNTATAGIKTMTDNTVAVSSAFFQAQANFKQLDQAVTQAEQSEAQAAQGVANAQHSAAQAVLAVAQARQSQQQAILGVQNAENQLTKSEVSEHQARVALTQAEAAAAQELLTLKRQVADQADTQAEAELRLLDAQDAVNAAGLQNVTLASLGGPTAANEANYRLLLTLQEAQNNLNDTTAQGQALAAQNAAAQAAGVNGAQQVIAAQQQLASAQDQTKQSAQALAQAQQGVTQASQAVANAVWSEQQASQAVKQASDAERAAKQAVQLAKDADSRSTDLNSAAGVRNFQAIEQLFEDNRTLTGDTGLATAATEQQAVQFGITKTAVDNVIASLTQIPVTTPFSIVGTPSLNLTALIQQASAEGISPFTLGLPSADVQLGLDTLHGKKAGGIISGPGTGTSDSILAITNGGSPLRVSNGEFIVNAADTAKNLGLLEAINSGRVGGFATGGQVDGKSLMAVNFRLAGWDAFLQGTSNALQMFGYHTPNLPPPTSAIDFGTLGAAAISGAAAVSGLKSSASANEALMQQIFAAQFGWTGPEWAATQYLMMRESGFNNTAQNPTSTAYGQFQFLDSTWASYGIPKTSDPGQQDIAGGRYIKARYGDPIGAANHERAFNWYRNGGLVQALRAPKLRDTGGPIDPGWNVIYNGTGRPETSRSGAQEDALLAAVRKLGDRLDKLTGDIHVYPPQGASTSEVAAEVMRRMRFHGRW